ncbi:hypothetical protein BJF92_11120 [Rhizobium rhizosphaerae]|uniref:Uncharacterized protein n=1 Tax=Xaviernesmea rhizosphaerae TaxID=1672749 RepID=A0A1Q9AMR6_9HYPH|nr:hypothetical protein [Xaviernesmea rhizosphaerae]OLP56635.1 hypothetical protein BJF92_11120 [Xaviernesmea rhizosphaerae]OQP88361.1 hypothetical protein BTR14_02715 [Xaviernesmea rhizosphaerae]
MSFAGDLRTGFTGDVERKDSATEKLNKAAQSAQAEIGAVAAHAKDHPSATAMSALTIAAVAFLAGYVLGQGRRETNRWDRIW